MKDVHNGQGHGEWWWAIPAYGVVLPLSPSPSILLLSICRLLGYCTIPHACMLFVSIILLSFNHFTRFTICASMNLFP